MAFDLEGVIRLAEQRTVPQDDPDDLPAGVFHKAA